VIRLSLALLLLPLLWACANPEQVRKHTYPPNFRYISQGEVRGSMSALAVQINALDELLTDESVAPEDRERVIEILSEMQLLARDLNGGGKRSNHPRIDRYAPRLQNDIDRALRSARSQTPDYYAAGTISGACSYCHARPPDTPEPPNPIAPPSSSQD